MPGLNACRRTQGACEAERATAGAPVAFPGYYTLDTERNGSVEGMLSVNVQTGAVWYHAWHGSFLDELEA